MAKNFQSAVQRIQVGATRLEHELGWVFLHTSAAAFDSRTRLFWIALNPKFSEPSECQRSSEDGNAYRIGRWRGGSQQSDLQKQVCAFYELLAAELDCKFETLMDESLAGNFCPFGSHSWKALENKDATLQWCRDFWLDVLRICEPSVIICLGQVAYDGMRRAASEVGFNEGPPQPPVEANWGSVTYTLTRLSGPKPMLLVRLPHLSRYKIFGRLNNKPTKQLIKTVAKYLRSSH